MGLVALMALWSLVGLREAPTRLPAANRAMPLHGEMQCQQLIVTAMGVADVSMYRTS
jgi:hypothetical protein